MYSSFLESIDKLDHDRLAYVLDLYDQRFPGLSMMEIAALEHVELLFRDLGQSDEPSVVRRSPNRTRIIIDSAMPMEHHMIQFALRLHDVERWRLRRKAA